MASDICFVENVHIDVSENSGTPKSSILIGFSTINHPIWDTPIFGNTHINAVYSCFFICHLHFFAMLGTNNMPSHR